MAVEQFNLRAGQRAERKLLITVAEWDETTTVGTTTTTTQVREFLGTRTEDSSIEYNSEIEEMHSQSSSSSQSMLSLLS